MARNKKYSTTTLNSILFVSKRLLKCNVVLVSNNSFRVLDNSTHHKEYTAEKLIYSLLLSKLHDLPDDIVKGEDIYFLYRADLTYCVNCLYTIVLRMEGNLANSIENFAKEQEKPNIKKISCYVL
jgi:hypothetical protein